MKRGLIAEAFEKAGIVSCKIQAGDLWTVHDDIITFPEDRLPTAKKTPHEHRTVAILSCKEDCEDPTHLNVLITPLSTKTDIKHKTDFLLKKGISGLRENSYVRLGLIQPVLKMDLIEPKIGTLEKDTWDSIITVLLANVGAIPRPINTNTATE